MNEHDWRLRRHEEDGSALNYTGTDSDGVLYRDQAAPLREDYGQHGNPDGIPKPEALRKHLPRILTTLDAEALRIAKGIPLLQSMGLVGAGFFLAMAVIGFSMWWFAG